MDEFQLIDRFFKRARTRADVILGIGDDAALVKPDPDAAVISALAVLSAPPGELPDGAGFARALARTALNRLAAQGASPAWITLGLTLAEANSAWLEAFSTALEAIIEPHGAVLIGGDTTEGPTTATLIAHGPAPAGRRDYDAPPRSGDAIYISGNLGCAAGAKNNDGGMSDARPARVNEGRTAWPFTAAAGDLRESLAASLIRLIGRYGLGAEIDSARLPVSAAGAEILKRSGGARIIVDVYADAELCFVVGAGREAAFENAMAQFESGCTRIGRVVDKTGVHLS